MNPRHILVNLRHPQVDYWTLKANQAEPLRHAFPEAEVVFCGSRAEFESRLPEAEVCMVWSFRQEYFDMAPNLKVVSTPAAGRDYFNVTPPPSVQMLYGGYHGKIIGETVCGMILGMCRGLIPAITRYSDMEWPRAELFPHQHSLHGSTVMILGFGNIGQHIGRRLKAFDVRILGMRRHADAPRPAWFDDGDFIFPPSRLEELLPSADHLVLALPRSPETDHLMDARRLALLPAHATLVNIGRGNAIDEAALCDALRQGTLAGAFLDVFQTEPLPADSILRICPNLWWLPHASAIAPDYLDLYVEELVEKLKRL